MHNYLQNIQGQDYVCKILQSQIDSDKIAHAYLFSGPAGCGKFACAKAFIKSLEAQDLADKIDNEMCPDVKILKPQGANGYLVRQIKEIVNDSNLAPIMCNYKFYIICDADKLNMSSANAFLKTLEEPSEKVCFILIANNHDCVLPTIVSRCQNLKFQALGFKQALSFVQNQSGCASDDAQMALNLFGGNTTKAIEFSLDQNLIDLHSEVINIMQNIENMTDWECLKRSNDVVVKIKEIVDVYKKQLEDNIKELSEVLDGPAISLIEDQNKRSINAKQKDLLMQFMSSIKFYFRYLLDKSDSEAVIHTLNVLSEIEVNLAYNINMQNFCDVVLLMVKYKGNIDYDKNSSC